jgi:hypothetical protein
MRIILYMVSPPRQERPPILPDWLEARLETPLGDHLGTIALPFTAVTRIVNFFWSMMGLVRPNKAEIAPSHPELRIGMRSSTGGCRRTWSPF